MNPDSTPNLRSFAEQWPKARIGILRCLWPTIRTCLGNGHSLRAIHQTLHLDGVDMAYSTFCWAVAALRRSVPPQSRLLPTKAELVTAPGKTGEPPGAAVGADPLSNLKRLSEHRPGFEYTGTLPDEKLFGPK